jgi:hypothetical protein
VAAPPLSPEELREQSMFVYVGRVTDVRQSEAPGDGGTNLLCEADMDVDEVEKAVLGSGEEHPTLHYWRAAGREPGWAGDIGQNSQIEPGARIRAYVTYDGEGRAQLLEPNGWEPA